LSKWGSLEAPGRVGHRLNPVLCYLCKGPGGGERRMGADCSDMALYLTKIDFTMGRSLACKQYI